ncbi:4-alpha-glucanotransferase [Rhizobium sp. SGZ-381]|uniref:4-alpha-glucanotransferase n=1 Tax=Rhizobium sp. SGZ-381 TaxID=3342800 RepID=UPI00366C7B01
MDDPTTLASSPSTPSVTQGHTATLDELARQHGIEFTRPDPDGREVAISRDTKRKILSALNVTVEDAALMEAAPVCFLPDVLSEDRLWGLSLQLYELRSDRNWGIGDFADLRAICGLAGRVGADFIGLNPLHAPFMADPTRCSPYEPSSRQWLNPFYIAVDQVPGFAPRPDLDKALQKLRQAKLVDYPAVATAKLRELRRLWQAWRKANLSSGAYGASAFESFLEQFGESLRRHALFEVISADMVSRGLPAGWRNWPSDMQAPDSPAVVTFAQSRLDEIEFHMWLQWVAHVQLSDVVGAAEQAGLRIGLYLDLAVGEALDGSATWSEPDIYVSSASIGGPPDPWAVDGQDWRLAAFLPSKIAEGDPSPYRRMLDVAMRYAGAVRIDHAAALARLFLVPFDGTPADGAYVAYPKEDMLQVLAEASHDHHCLVIGEDLGNLPEGLREDLARASLLSYRIFSYELNEEGFVAPADYPALSLACVSTQDHQTLGGWWSGADIKARAEHGLVPQKTAKADLTARAKEKSDLVRALALEGLPVPDAAAAVLKGKDLDQLALSLHRFLARTPSMLLAVRLADLTKEAQPTNIPGTSDSHPNWRPKLSVPVEALEDLDLLSSVAGALREERQKTMPGDQRV